MRLPIRVRLTAWYVGLLAVTIVALGVFVVVRLRSDLTADFDHSLRSAALQIRGGYERQGAVKFQSLSATVLRILPADSGSQLIDADGRVVRTSGVDLPSAPLVSAAERRGAVLGRYLLKNAHGPYDSEPFRVVATAVDRGGQRETLVVASSLEGVDSAVHRVLTLMLLGGSAVLLVIAAGGWMLARKAFRPVARLTEQAGLIEVNHLDTRLPVPPTTDEIADLAVTLNHMLDRLERGVEEKRRLVADASHELRTPLAVMRSEIDVALAYDNLQPEAVRVLSSASEEVGRMTRTVENLLTLARVDEGRLELLRLPVELRELVDHVAAELGSIAGDKGVTIATGGDDATVSADRERIRHVVVNLVENAIKYSHAGGEVTITTWHRNGEVGVDVADAGVGIPQDALPHVFDRFYRVDRARDRETGGSGLGLAICHVIAAAHGGRLSAESEQARGSRFSLALPSARRPQ